MPPKGERRKQQIIDTAKKMFIEKGFQSTHIGQVCDELNIARGTVYQYFSNKKEILYAILDSVVEDIEDTLDPDDLQTALDYVSYETPEGGRELKERVSDQELRDFLQECELRVDEAGVPDEPFEVRISEELKQAIDRALPPEN